MDTTGPVGPSIEHTGRPSLPPAPSNGNGRATAAIPTTPLRSRRRWRPGLLFVGLMLVIGSMLGGLLLFDSVTTTTPVLVAGRDLEAGQVLTGDDVTVVDIALPPGTPALSYDDRSYLGGPEVDEPVRALRGFVPEGAILTREHFLDRSDAVAEGKALLGLRLQSGWYPSGLRLGDRVEVFRVAGRSASDETATYLGQAEVWRIWRAATEEDPTDDLILDLLIDEELQGPAVQANAEDGLRLTVVRAG